MISVVAILSLLYGWLMRNDSEGRKPEDRSVFIGKVYDGDTVEADFRGKTVKIRLIGIDAPEMKQRPWGRRSKKYLEEMVSASGWQLGIEFDVEKLDKYDRTLAYLWTRDGRLVNEEMLKGGHAVLYTFPPNVKHVDRLKAAQVIARENRTGIWGKNGLKQMPSEYRKEHPSR